MTTKSEKPSPTNLLGLDFAREAERMAAPPAPIVDVHSHINGVQAAGLYRRAAELFGIELTYSMSKLEEVDALRDAMDGRMRFIAVPNYWNTDDRAYEMTTGYVKRIAEYHAKGSRIAKFWAAPRGIDYAEEVGGSADFMRLNSPARRDQMQAARDLGMIFMTHVADPDTWFRTKYADATRYGTKAQQYEPLEELLDEFDLPWIAAHMGGWPEDLEFLTGLLDRHDNLHLDTSATKWMVRELSVHSRDELIAFFTRFRGRILFGSDIVTADEHLQASAGEGTVNEMYSKAANTREAFDLYASRYWALRTMFETDYDGRSPIADPDLAMVDPERHDELAAPPLHGKSLPAELLKSIYHDAAHALLDPLHEQWAAHEVAVVHADALAEC